MSLRGAGGDAAIWFRDYKLHPCNLPFGSHKVRSILLQAKLVPQSLRLPHNDGIYTGLLKTYKDSKKQVG